MKSSGCSLTVSDAIASSPDAEKFIYKLKLGEEGSDKNEIDIKLHGSVNHGDRQLKWTSSIFDGEIGGFFS